MNIPNGPSRLPVVTPVLTAGDMRGLGRRLAAVLRAGDLVILSGPLGAGKTTLTQGIADGLGVRGPITSPTFVIARVHPSLRSAAGMGLGGRPPALVHADAYRLGSVLELDDLDLDADLATSVTVVEWGEGLAEGLSEDRLQIAITPAPAGGAGGGADFGADGGTDGGTDGDVDGGADAGDGDAPRTVEISGVGSRWQDIQLPPAEVANRL